MTISVQSHKKLKPILNFDFLYHPNDELLFITSTDEHEVNLIMFSLNSGKSTGPNSLPTKILKLLKMRFLLT